MVCVDENMSSQALTVHDYIVIRRGLALLNPYDGYSFPHIYVLYFMSMRKP